jgi:hypothetical protein
LGYGTYDPTDQPTGRCTGGGVSHLSTNDSAEDGDDDACPEHH